MATTGKKLSGADAENRAAELFDVQAQYLRGNRDPMGAATYLMLVAVHERLGDVLELLRQRDTEVR